MKIQQGSTDSKDTTIYHTPPQNTSLNGSMPQSTDVPEPVQSMHGSPQSLNKALSDSTYLTAQIQTPLQNASMNSNAPQSIEPTEPLESMEGSPHSTAHSDTTYHTAPLNNNVNNAVQIENSPNTLGLDFGDHSASNHLVTEPTMFNAPSAQEHQNHMWRILLVTLDLSTMMIGIIQLCKATASMRRKN